MDQSNMMGEQTRDISRRVHDFIASLPTGIRLVAVSKGFDLAAIQAAMDGGALLFGESRIQEAEDKILALQGRPIHWHFIGHLQSNKVNKVVRLFDLIHSVDSLSLAQAINQAAEKTGKRQDILLQVNVSGETSKFGLHPDELRDVFDVIREMSAVSVKGLMTMAPQAPADTRVCFRELRLWRDRLEAETGQHLPELSMGMSGDYREAIAEGATLVRIGRFLFGDRSMPQKM